MQRLQGALVEMLTGVGLDPAKPQEVARELKLNSTLTWSVSRLVAADHPMSALRYAPGLQAVDKLISATGKKGAERERLDCVREAAVALEEVLKKHADDRRTLELILDGATDPEAKPLERSRKLAFRGDSGLYGVQAKTRLISYGVAPNADGETVDLLMLGGFLGVRRLRADVSWPLFRSRTQGSIDHQDWVPLFPSQDDEGNPAGFVPGFDHAHLLRVEHGGGTDFLIPPGPVGNSALFDCFHAMKMIGRADRYAKSDGQSGSVLGTHVPVPTERLIFDLIVHKDLEIDRTVSVSVHAVDSYSPDVLTQSRSNSLPIQAGFRSLSGSPPVVHTPAVAQYPELLSKVCSELEWDLSAFRALRCEIEYPPMRSVVMARFQLPHAS